MPTSTAPRYFLVCDLYRPVGSIGYTLLGRVENGPRKQLDAKAASLFPSGRKSRRVVLQACKWLEETPAADSADVTASSTLKVRVIAIR